MAYYTKSCGYILWIWQFSVVFMFYWSISTDLYLCIYFYLLSARMPLYWKLNYSADSCLGNTVGLELELFFTSSSPLKKRILLGRNGFSLESILLINLMFLRFHRNRLYLLSCFFFFWCWGWILNELQLIHQI